jgi:hypothetical protein
MNNQAARIRMILVGWVSANGTVKVFKNTPNGNKEVLTGSRAEAQAYANNKGLTIIFRPEVSNEIN